MNREDALRVVAGSRDGESGKQQSPTPDKRTSREQLFALERGRFEERLARRALALERKTGSWPEMSWFSRHRRRFSGEMSRAYQQNFRDPPCKNWRESVRGSEYEEILAKVWETSLHDWARKYSYLAAPSAKCECAKCGSEVYAGVDWSEPLSMPSEQ